MRENLDFSSDEAIQDIYDCAMNVYGKGIAIPSNYHPCGWDWLDFTFVDDILEHEFQSFEISNSCGNPAYLFNTLKEILKKTNGEFAFEVNCFNINWYED